MKLVMLLSLATTAFAASGLDLLPDSPIGRHARAWFAAYASATDEAIAAYARDHVAPGRPTPAERAERMRGVKAAHGALTVVRVPMDDERELTVVVRDAHGDTLSLSVPRPAFAAVPAHRDARRARRNARRAAGAAARRRGLRRGPCAR
jgi:hypothetical protein